MGIHALTVYNGDIVAGGPLTTAGGQPALRIARWNGTTWSDFDGGTDGLVNALTVFDESLLVGGNFLNVGGLPSLRLARWDDAPLSVLDPWSPVAGGRIDASPNPFTAQVQLQYTLSGATPVAISVYDVRGRFVRSLTISTPEDGSGQALWDGRDDRGRRTPAGVYFVHVTSTTGTLEIKVLRQD